MTHRPTLVPVTVIAIASAIAIAACGGGPEAAPRSPGAAAPPEPAPRTVEEAQDQIARARADVEGATGGAPAKSATSESSQEPRAPADLPEAQTRQTERTDKERSNDSCGSPCRALDSMRRAVEALCRMTGEEDSRCVDAKKTLTDSTSRLSSCTCGRGR